MERLFCVIKNKKKQGFFVTRKSYQKVQERVKSFEEGMVRETREQKLSGKKRATEKKDPAMKRLGFLFC